MVGSQNVHGPLVGSIDEGTSSVRFLVFASKTSEVLTYHQLPLPHHCQKEGWFEQDPMLILNNVIECINISVDNLKKIDINPKDIVTVGITNQRETTVVWDCETGQPLYNAIVWMDMRTETTVEKMIKLAKKNKDHLKPLCGLPFSTYFSALKLRWLIDNVPEVQNALEKGTCMFGTIDTWLIWNLTGGANGGLHITDVTNASRTMFMNIETLKWDVELCNFFDVPMNILPEIRSSSEIYGYLSSSVLKGVPISGCLGDQQSALVGQMCFHKGQAKCTYGTGCFLLYNTGQSVVQSHHGLLTTVGYQLGKDAKPIYALEGSVAIAGAAMQWLRDNLRIIDNVMDAQEMAEAAPAQGEVVIVPAFSGLYAPYWRTDARSIICGLTEDTMPEHLVKATLEAVCFQIRDILESMALDCGYPLQKLQVDGGMTVNNLLMQMQADLCGIPVLRPLMTESTALGAAMAAGNAQGIEVWDLESMVEIPGDQFNPNITEDQRDMRYKRWKMAIARSLGWSSESETDEALDLKRNVMRSIPAGVFVMTSFALMILAKLYK